MKVAKIILIVIGFILFFISAFFLFEPGNDPTGFFVYTPSIAVLNQKNNVGLNGDLEIEFITKGTKDLEITALKGKAEFLGLQCGKDIINLNPSKSITYKNYNCKENSKVIVKILSKEVEVNINFGEDSQIAKNSAS